METEEPRVFDSILLYAKVFAKWIIVALIVGSICGFVGFAFYYMVKLCTGIRMDNYWLIFTMPAGAALIAVIYKVAKIEGMGTNHIIDSINLGKKIPLILAPVVFISTVITHLCGGSAGREGAALQIGGSIGKKVGTLMRVDSKDMRVVTLCGMCALFAALFGTPLTATIFVIEVISVGVFCYSYLVPCTLTSMVAYGIAKFLGSEGEAFRVITLSVDTLTVIRVIVLGILCALLSIVFCQAMHRTEEFLEKIMPNSIIRGLVGGGVLIVLTLIFGTAYNGTGNAVIAAAVGGGDVPAFSFLIKILFTAIALGCGFKGGEIVPSFFIGACFGNVIGPLLGLPASFAASIGLIAMLCGSFNCPLAAMMLSVEMFGAGNIVFFVIVCGISYMLSGHFGIYKSQKIVHSKIKAEVVNRFTR